MRKNMVIVIIIALVTIAAAAHEHSGYQDVEQNWQQVAISATYPNKEPARLRLLTKNDTIVTTMQENEEDVLFAFLVYELAPSNSGNLSTHTVQKRGSGARGGYWGSVIGAGCGAVVGGLVGSMGAGTLVVPGAALGASLGGTLGGAIGYEAGKEIGKRQKRSTIPTRLDCLLIREAFDQTDSNKNGVIDFEEIWISAATNSAEIRRVFDKKDENRDGVLQPAEINQCTKQKQRPKKRCQYNAVQTRTISYVIYI